MESNLKLFKTQCLFGVNYWDWLQPALKSTGIVVNKIIPCTPTWRNKKNKTKNLSKEINPGKYLDRDRSITNIKFYK